MMLELSRVRERLFYSPDTGIFTWRDGPRKGCEAGHLSSEGYRYIKIDGVSLKAARLAYWLFHGVLPAIVDHKNRNRDDNRIVNLRAATKSENAANSKKRIDNSSGFKGVTRHKKRWRAMAQVRGKRHSLGCYATPEEAHAAYMKFQSEQHGGFACAGT